MKRKHKYTQRENERYRTYLRKYRKEITKAAKALKTNAVREYANPVSKETLVRLLRSSQLSGKRTSVTRIAREHVFKGALTKRVFADKLKENKRALRDNVGKLSVTEITEIYGNELSDVYQKLKSMGYLPKEAGSIISQEYFGS